MTFGAAISQHPLTTQATGEVVGQVLEDVGVGPDLAVLFVTGPHLGLMAEIAETVRTVLRPGHLLGVSASSVIGGSTEVEEGRPSACGPGTPARSSRSGCRPSASTAAGR
jgi:small ligand-binding sensory domain FIST